MTDDIAAEIIAELIDADLQTLPYKDRHSLVTAHLQRAWNQGYRAALLQQEHQADYDDAVAADEWFVP